MELPPEDRETCISDFPQFGARFFSSNLVELFRELHGSVLASGKTETQ